jgi:hypothetical protein
MTGPRVVSRFSRLRPAFYRRLDSSEMLTHLVKLSSLVWSMKIPRTYSWKSIMLVRRSDLTWAEQAMNFFMTSLIGIKSK